MKQQLIYISVCALIAATSPGCSDRSASMQCSEFTFGSLDSICLGEFTPLGIDVENMGIGAPSCMALADDTIMAVLDARGEYQVRLIDLKSGRAMNYVHVGEGPDEMLHVNTIGIRNGAIDVAGDFDNKTGVIERDADGRYAFRNTGKTDYPFVRHLAVDDNVSISMPATPDSIRFIRTDASICRNDTFRVFPISDPNANNAVFQADACISADRKKLITVNRSWGIVEMHDLSSMQPTAIAQGPVKVDSRIEVDDTPYGTRIMQKPMHIVLAGVSAFDDGFFTGYVGACSDNPESMRHGISRLIRFDNHGNPERYYILPCELITFAVSNDGNTLYGFKYGDNGSLELVSTPI